MFRKILSSKHFNLWDVTYQFDVKSFLFFCNNGKTLFFLSQFLRESFISLRVDLGIRRCLQINHRLFSSLSWNIICCVKRKVRAKVFDELQALI